ncbi:MAG: amino acid-binding protein [Lachnospiraceae bacterium]|nr:amino acid-binding protein [Lachnospiraceae bacterium]
MLEQVSIYAENKRGMLQHITRILLDADINILGSVTNDSAEYGIIRMVVSEPKKAYDALLQNGFLCRRTPVLGVEVEDEVGNLNKLLCALEESYINVNYIYLSFNRDSGKPIMVFHCEDCYEVADCLTRKGFTVL